MGKYKFTPLTWKRRNWKAGKRYADADCRNLYVQFSGEPGGPVTGRSAIFRYSISLIDEYGHYVRKDNGRVLEEPHQLGLGELVEFEDLIAVRLQIPRLRKLVKDGKLRDPKEYQRQLRAARAAENAPVKTFDEVWLEYMAKNSKGWRSSRHASSWDHSRRTIKPVIGSMDVAAVTRHDFTRAVIDTWCTTAVTASRTLSRMIIVHDWSIASGYVPEANRISLELCKRALGSQGVRRKVHLAARPHSEVPAIVRLLRASNEAGSLALIFTILTASRSNETLGARWHEISGNVWTVPANRMKRNHMHMVPLSTQALAVLARMKARKRKPDGIVFPGRYHGKLSGAVMLDALHRAGVTGSTVHGFRSSFRDWAAEKEDAPPREVAEAALAHGVADNESEAAYLRTTYFAKRQTLMQQWSDYVMPAGEVISLEDRKKYA